MRLALSRLRSDRISGARRGDVAQPQLVALVYELLDAHDDTGQLAGELRPDPEWEAHLEYLRALQRTGRELLAHVDDTR